MPEWIKVLVEQWNPSSNWNSALTHYLSKNKLHAPDQIHELFGQLREVPGFSECSQEILPVLLLTGDLKTTLMQLHDFCLLFEEESHHPFDFKHPFVPALLTVFGRSDFLTRCLFKRPLLSSQILDSPFLEKAKTLEIMTEELRHRLELEESVNKEVMKKALRFYKYEEFLRITIRDLAELAPFSEILEELTSIATCCVQIALEASHKIARGLATFQISKNSTEQNDMPFIILGMGKLGGNELNYSSDIDPIFLCNANPDEYTLPLTADKVLKTTARSLIELIGEITADGFVARVDMRLRPGGDTSSLFQTLEDTEFYYEVKGETWERQALIKARPIAGNIIQGEMFLKNLSPFIFSKMIDENMLAEIRKIKERIEKEHLKQHLNVKLGVGGIREIEFFVQIFQLLYGGAKPELRTRNTLETIHMLQEKKYISPSDAATLSKSYVFLRKLEHRLQMDQELQIHVIPGDPKKQQALARFMGYDEENIERARRHLLQDISDTMVRVRSIFSGLFDQEYLEIEASIRNNTHFNHLSPDVQSLLENSARQFTAIIRQSEHSNLGLRFQQLFERIQAKLDYYQHLLDYPASLRRLAGIAETSEFLWNYLLNHLELLKQLDASEVLHSRIDWENQLSDKLESCQDEEQRLDALREFKHAITFIIGSAELGGLLPYMQARQRLTTLSEVVLQAAYLLVRKQLAQQFGFPYCENQPARLAIIGLGKMGGNELNYHSDLDLIFICSGTGTTSGPKQISNYEYYAKLAQRFISTLSSITRAGEAYKIDTRLRPSGKGGPLVCDLDFFQNYHLSSQPWEHQALTKGRLVGGDQDEAWMRTVEKSIAKTVYEWTPPSDLKQQIFHLRERKEKELSGETERRKNIKEGYGGLLDIEYLTQYLQVCHGPKIPELRITRTLLLLEQFRLNQILDPETARELIKGYTFYRLLESYLRLLCDTDTNILDFDNLLTDKLVLFLHHHGFSVTDVFETYCQTCNKIRQIYLKFMTDK
ncbi:MAG: hypothetical protein HQM13_08665 [SAR324 cluster bacterium]|nr:hypothetical protein [SAR324 cluster bacterium]